MKTVTCSWGILFLLSINVYSQGMDDYKRGIALVNKGNYTGSIEFFTKAIDANKTSHEYYMQRGLAYFELQETDLAMTDFLKANAIKAGSASYYLARCYALKGNIENTLKYLEENLIQREKILYFEIVKDRAFYDFLEKRQWNEFWEKNWYDEYQQILNEIGFMVNSKDYYEAIEFIDQSVSKFPQGNELYAMRAGIYAELGSHTNAIEDYSEAIRIKPNVYEYYNKRAILYRNTDKLKKAITDFKESLRINGTQVNLYYAMAYLEFKEELFPEALESINNYLEYIPDDSEGLYLGALIHKANGEYLNALEYLNRLLKINPSKAEYFHARGETYLEINSDDFLQYAIDDFSMALDLQPNNPLTYLKRARANYEKGNYREACFDIQQAEKLGSLEALVLKDQYCGQ